MIIVEIKIPISMALVLFQVADEFPTECPSDQRPRLSAWRRCPHKVLEMRASLRRCFGCTDTVFQMVELLELCIGRLLGDH